MGWLFHNVVVRLLHVVWHEFLLPDDLWSHGTHVWVRHYQCENLFEQAGNGGLGQDTAAVLPCLFLSSNLNLLT